MNYSVVRIYVVQEIPHPYCFWYPPKIEKLYGTAFAIKVGEKLLLLTSAHNVYLATYIECQLYARNYPLTLVDYSLEYDLAVLGSDDSDLWGRVQAWEVGDSMDEIEIVGFPEGEENICIASGRVMRLCWTSYNRVLENAAIQIESKLYPGSSGSPIISGGKVGGVVMRGTGKKYYAVPYFLISRYLNDIERWGKSQRAGHVNITFSPTKNPCLREYLLQRIPPEVGILVHKAPGLQPGDILIRIENHYVTCGGCVLAYGGTLPFSYLFRLLHPGDKIALTYIRGGQLHTTEIEVETYWLGMPMLESEIERKYYCFGGLVFQNLNYWFLLDGDTIDTRKQHLLSRPDAIILKEIWPNQLTSGYEYKLLTLKTVNERSVRNIEELKNYCSFPSQRFIKFEFDEGDVLVLPWENALHISYSRIS